MAVRLRAASAFLLLAGGLATLVPGGCTPGGPPSRTPTPPVVRQGLLPDLVGTSKAAAERRLASLGLLYVIDPVGTPFDDRVVGQRPAAGTPLEEVDEMVLEVRCQPAPCPSPPAGEVIFDPCTCASRPV